MSNEDFRILSGCLDEAIAEAVTLHDLQREHAIFRGETERVAVLAHELRNALQTATLAFDIMTAGSVGVESSTARILGRSLTLLHDILERSFEEVKFDSVRPSARIAVATLIEEAEIASTLEASSRGVTFAVTSTPTLEVEGDSLLLAGAIDNLVKNALKFTVPGGHVSLKTSAIARRVLIDIQDQCGGLPDEKAEELFGLFAQRSTDRSGLGVGLSIARANVRAMNGDICVRNLPTEGCVFTIDLPQAS